MSSGYGGNTLDTDQSNDCILFRDERAHTNIMTQFGAFIPGKSKLKINSRDHRCLTWLLSSPSPKSQSPKSQSQEQKDLGWHNNHMGHPPHPTTTTTTPNF